MTQAAFDIAAAVAQAAAQTPDMKEAQKGGGYTPPAEGACFVTLVGYIELGIQIVAPSKTDPVKYPGGPEEQVQLVFELSGKGHEPKEVDGKKIPERLSVTLKKSLNEKAWFFKIFNTLNYDKQATHFAQLLGKHFRAKVVHSGSKDKIFAGFKESAANGGGYTFAPPTYNPVDPETLVPDVTVTKVFPKPEVLTPLKLFLWDFPSKEMWASLYIEGKYDERKDEKTGKVISPARSKNVLQEKIRQASNFKGSPLAELLVGEVDLTGITDQPDAQAVAEEEAPQQPTDDADAAAALAAL